MPSYDSRLADADRAEYARLAATAREARERHDELVLTGATSASAADALAEAVEAEKARDRVAKRLAKSAGATSTSAPAQAQTTTSGRGESDSDERAVSRHKQYLGHLATRTPTGRPGDNVQADLTFARPDGTMFVFEAKRSQRDAAGELLSTLGAPARTKLLQTGLRAMFGISLTSAQAVGLRREESRQYQRTIKGAVPRDWYLTPCLSADTLAAAPGTYSLSTWPLSDRIITPYAPRMWAAHSVEQVGRLLLQNGEANDEANNGLTVLLLELLRGSTWGTIGQRSTPEQLMQTVQDAAEDVTRLRELHNEIAGDTVARLRELATRSPEIVLFGKPRIGAADDRDGTG
jgi:hypothetical protein